jgi:hypothetical protein
MLFQSIFPRRVQTFSFDVHAPSISSPLTPGTYRVSDGATNAVLGKNFTLYGASGSTGSGTLTLNSISTTARTAAGTFTYVVVDQLGAGGVTHSITNGKFNVTFEVKQ